MIKANRKQINQNENPKARYINQQSTSIIEGSLELRQIIFVILRKATPNYFGNK